MTNPKQINSSASWSDAEWTKKQLLRKMDARAELFPEFEALIRQGKCIPPDATAKQSAPQPVADDAKALEATSKLIALVLRHKPEELGLTMDSHGWINAQSLIDKLNERKPFTRAMLEQIVREDKKQRYAFSRDGAFIRANQGHSIPVDLEFIPQTPPNYLWHGTSAGAFRPIARDGLKPMSRQYVHLSESYETAIAVGKRHGPPILIAIDARQMLIDGYTFFKSENGVWLTEHVPPKYFFFTTPWVEEEWFDALRRRAQEREAPVRVVRNVIGGMPRSVRFSYYVDRQDADGHAYSIPKPVFYVCSKGDYNLFSDGEKFYCVCPPENYLPPYAFGNAQLENVSTFDDFLDQYGFHYGNTVPFERMPHILLRLLKIRRIVVGDNAPVFARSHEEGSLYIRLAAYYNMEGRWPRDIKELRLGLTNADGEILRQETLIQGEEQDILAWLGKPQNQQAILDQAQAMLAEHTRK